MIHTLLLLPTNFTPSRVHFRLHFRIQRLSFMAFHFSFPIFFILVPEGESGARETSWEGIQLQGWKWLKIKMNIGL